jgi:hypothetical protein
VKSGDARNPLSPHISKDRAILWYISGIPPEKTHRYGGEKPLKKGYE